VSAESTGAEAAVSSLGPKPSNPSADSIPSVDWWTTSRCNLACDFCYGPVPGTDPAARRDEIANAIAASSAGAVTFCGGEPLLLRGLSHWAAEVRRHGKDSVLNTNGMLLRPRLRQSVRKAWRVRLRDFTAIGISVEGSTEEVQRAMRGPKADLREALAAADRVRREPGVMLKIATVISAVNRENLPELARLIRELKPNVWRLYQYSDRGDQNSGQLRHRLPDEDFLLLAKKAADLASGVPTVSSTEAETMGCLIVDPAGNVLQPSGTGYARRGNLLEEPLDQIWAQMSVSSRKQIIENKGWLSVLR
jgi:MoaA/NifB/PqqE/SkfB family radical SAM enzyme